MSSAITAIILMAIPMAGDADASGAGVSADSASYVNTSFEAAEAMARGERLAASGRWREASETLQSAIERFGDRVVSIGSGRYVSVADCIGGTISGWPEAGLDAYRRRYESIARGLFESIRVNHEPGPLLEIGRSYFATAAGAAAFERAAQLVIERGSFTAARRWYDRLLAEHPDRQRHQTDWQAMRAICALLEGDDREADHLLGVIQPETRPPAAIAAAASAVDWLRLLRARRRHDPTAEDAATRGAVAPHGVARHTTAQPEAVWWRCVNPRSMTRDLSQIDAEEGMVFDSTRADIFERALRSGRLQAFAPALGDGRVYLHDARGAWSVDRNRPEAMAWIYRAVQAGDPGAPGDEWSFEEGAPAYYSTLYNDGLLYLNIELPRSGEGRRAAAHTPALICLDAATGREIWRSALASFGTQFEQTSLDGAPVLHEGVLAALARRRKSFGFEACHLLRFDAASGRLLSSTHLAEAPTGSYGYHRATRSLPSAAAGRFFATTNLGAIAAICAYTGRIEWLATYETDYGADHDALWPDRGGKPYRSWHYQPPRPWRDALVCIPLDADFILILEQDSGVERVRIPLDALGDAQTILGISGDRMFTAGALVTCYDLRHRRVVWQQPIATGQLFGSGAVSSAGIFVPTDRALLTYPLEGGQPRALAWSVEDAGNIAVGPDEIIVASSRGVSGVTGRNVAMHRLRDRMAARPDDPTSALSLARLAFRFGDTVQGINAAKSAAERTTRLPPPDERAARKRLFDSLLKLAEDRLRRPDAPAPATVRDDVSLAAAAELLDIAAPFAAEPASEVRRTLLVAKVRVLQDRPADAIGAYQRLLSDGRLRDRKVGHDDLRATAPMSSCVEKIDAQTLRFENGQTAANVAEEWIDAVISRLGRRHYDAIDLQAAGQFDRAIERDDDGALRKVAIIYPNSRAAFAAWRELARRARVVNDRTDAVRAYRRALARSVAERPETIAEFVDYLLADGQMATARQWLRRGARNHPAFAFKRDGATFTFQTYLSRRFGDGLGASPAGPACLAGPVDRYQRIFPDRAAALEPRCLNSTDPPWGQLLVYSGELLEARSAATGRAVWPQGFASATEPLWLGPTRGLLIFSTPYEIFALTRTSGRTAWTFGQPPPDDPLHEPESSARWCAWTMDDDRVYLASDRGEVACVAADTGELNWRRDDGPPSGNLLETNGRLLCRLTWQQRRSVFDIFDARSGEPIRSIHSGASRNRITLHVTPDDRLVDVTPRGVQCFDLATGKSLWRVVTDRHISAGAVAVDDDAVYVTDDGLHVTKLLIEDGLIAWRSPPLAESTTTGVWGELAAGMFLVARDDRLAALDTDNGAIVWTVHQPGCLEVQAPRLAADAVVTITRAPAMPNHAEEIDLAVTDVAAYDIRAFRIDDGAPIRIGDGHFLRTPPIESFGGLFVRDQAIVVLDGAELIGFAGRTSQGDPSGPGN